MMNKAGWALVLASTMMIGSAAIAVPPSDTAAIEVNASDAPTAWSRHAAREFDANLEYPRPFNGDYHAGLVKVGFRSDSDGRIADVAVLESSRNADLDRAAVLAVQRTRILPAPPSAVASGRPVQAWIYFASTDRQESKLLERIRRELAAGTRVSQSEPLVVTVSAQ